MLKIIFIVLIFMLIISQIQNLLLIYRKEIIENIENKLDNSNIKNTDTKERSKN